MPRYNPQLHNFRFRRSQEEVATVADGEYLSDGDATSLDSVQDVRLLVLLQDLVKQRGRTQAADVLGVNYNTVVGTIESGRLAQPLERAARRSERGQPAGGQGGHEVLGAAVVVPKVRKRALDERVPEAVTHN